MSAMTALDECHQTVILHEMRYTSILALLTVTGDIRSNPVIPY